MSKPEWGVKRICTGCGARYYDLKRSPPTCPKCGAVYSGKTTGRVRRSSPAVVKDELVPKVRALPPDVPVEEDELVADDDIEVIEEDEDGAEDEGLIEDTSDLGEDDDDMTGVIERMDEEDRL